jgi:hypothetical protein
MDLPEQFTLAQIRQVMDVLGLDLDTTASVTITARTVTVTTVIPTLADSGSASWHAGHQVGSVPVSPI